MGGKRDEYAEAVSRLEVLLESFRDEEFRIVEREDGIHRCAPQQLIRRRGVSDNGNDTDTIESPNIF